MTSKKGKKDNGVFHSKRRTPMLPIEAIERIRVLSECGKGSKAISALTGISRPTVRKYLTEIKSNKPISTKVARPSVLDPHKDQIHRWFLSCRGHCPALLRKIQSQLGIQISLRTLQKYCKPWRSQELSSVEKTERYEVPAGNEMQIDFGFDDILIGGVKTRVSFFVAVLSYSRRVFVKLYPQENQAAWFDGIESAFEYFGGIPVAVLSDNTRCLVDGRAEKGNIRFNQNYLHLSHYWGFNTVACKPYRAKTKGKVERMVGYVKTSCLSGLEAKNWADAQQQITDWALSVADSRTIDGLDAKPIERFQVEMPALRTYFGPRMTNHRLVSRKLDVSGLIQIDGNRYQILDTDPGSEVEVVVLDDQISVFHHCVLVAQLNKTTDAYQATTFKHQTKEAWVPQRSLDSEIRRSLEVYDQVVLEASYANA